MEKALNYTPAEYIEDTKLALSVYSKKFAHLPQFKDDLVQSAVIKLWKVRQKYDRERGAYSSFAYRVVYHEMAGFLRLQKRHLETVSLNTEYDDYTLEDIIASEQQELVTDCQYLIATAKDIIANHKSKSVKEILTLHIQGKPAKEIAQIRTCSRANVYKIIDNFRTVYKNRLSKEGYIETY